MADKAAISQNSNTSNSNAEGAELEKNNISPVTAGAEHFFYKFVNPVLNDMQTSVNENMKVLDELHDKIKAENRERRLKPLQEHIPAPLKGSGLQIQDVVEKLENIILWDDDEDNASEQNRDVTLHPLDEDGKMAVLSHSVAAYISTLDQLHLRHVATRIISDTTLWLSRLFRFFESAAYFHDDYRDGLLRICKLLLFKKYPKYSTEGFEAIYPRPPVLYLSSACRNGMGEFLCMQLGLPVSCVSVIPCGVESNNRYKMSTERLAQLVQDDLAAGKVPLLVVANAGTPVVGQVDNLKKIQEICKVNDIWLHLEGHNLATLTLMSVPNSVVAAKTGDSMTLTMGVWLGIPAIPYVSLFKASEPVLVHAAGLSSSNSHLRLSCLPIWICLQKLGYDGIVSKIKHSCELSAKLHEHLEKLSSIKLLSKDKPKRAAKSEQSPMSFQHLLQKAVSAILVLESVPPTCVFKYIGNPETTELEVAPYAANAEERNANTSANPAYLDALNKWMGQTLQRDIPEVLTDVIELDGEGICIRYCPLENAHIIGTTLQHMDEFMECLFDKVSILNATARQRALFRDIVTSHDNLELVDVGNWAGLGAVRYVPTDFASTCADSTDETKKNELNKINLELLHQVKNADSAFTLGESVAGQACIRFGMVTEDTDTEDLINMVYETGKEVEESSKFIETMATVVKKGIEAANKDLEQENVDKLMQEGIMRYVPIVGSLINWWSPAPKETSISGRTFDLASGVMESTENTYKYHMQIQNSPPPNKKQAITPPRWNSSDSSKISPSSLSTSESLNESSQEDLQGKGDQYDRQPKYTAKTPPSMAQVTENSAEDSEGSK